MKKVLFIACLLFSTSGVGWSQQLKQILKKLPAYPAQEQVQIMVLGSNHFGQENFYKNDPKADLFSAQRQKEVNQVNQLLLKYRPDMVMVEHTPEEQPALDSLYTLYRTGKVEIKDIPYGRAERYQFGYQIAKSLNHPRVYGVDCYENVSNRILTEGDNIESFQQGLTQFSAMGAEANKSFKEGTSLKDYLLFLNHPKVLDFTYQVIYVTPAKVQHGKFSNNAPARYQDTTHVSPQYIGAEFVSLFLEREIKIYSNIITTQQREKGKRLLVIMGQRHAAALSKIFVNDPAYKLVNPSGYLR